ncbi:hypothetical protein C8F01DRAFT_1254489 [Mycena amicta]|nr:hypothetical protein C8F01DRAFT_1254489 [Mycena amicta]
MANPSARKDVVPITKDEFVAKHAAFIDALSKTDVGRKCFLKVSQFVQTDLATEGFIALGLPAPRPIVVSHFNLEDLRETINDPSVRQLVEEAKKEFGFGESMMTTFAADTRMLLNAPAPMPDADNGTSTAMGVFKIPANADADVFKETVREFEETVLALPAIRKQVWDAGIWYQSKEVEREAVEVLGLAKPQALVVVWMEAVGKIHERLEDPALKDVINKYLVPGTEFAIGMDGDFFVAERFDRYERGI